MNRFETAWLALPLAVLTLATYGAGAEEQPPPPPKPQGGEQKPIKDPTQLSPRMREMLAPKAGTPAAVETAKPLPKLPLITLRGLVAGSGGDGSAAIEIKGGSIYLVRAGSSVQAAADNGQTVLLQIKSIGKDAIVIEVPELQQTLTIR